MNNDFCRTSSLCVALINKTKLIQSVKLLNLIHIQISFAYRSSLGWMMWKMIRNKLPNPQRKMIRNKLPSSHSSSHSNSHSSHLRFQLRRKPHSQVSHTGGIMLMIISMYVCINIYNSLQLKSYCACSLPPFLAHLSTKSSGWAIVTGLCLLSVVRKLFSSSEHKSLCQSCVVRCASSVNFFA